MRKGQICTRLATDSSKGFLKSRTQIKRGNSVFSTRNTVSIQSIKMKLQIIICALLLMVNTDGLLFGSNQTHGVSIEERLTLLEKQLTDEKRERFILQREYDQEKQKIAELERQVDALNETAPKRLQDISTQIQGALLSKYSQEIQELREGLNGLQTFLPNLTWNISKIQSYFQEKRNVTTLLIDDIKHNQMEDEEEMMHLKNSIASLLSSQTSILSRIAKFEDSVSFQSTCGFSRFSAPVSYVKFPILNFNVGGGYNNGTSVFTSPSDGYYVFYWFVPTCPSAIVKNGVDIQAPGNTVILYLDKFDQTYIKVTTCSIIGGGIFSGHKIK